jgi:hypothetical protein
MTQIPEEETPETLIAVAEPYCANVRVPVVPALERYIVSDVIAILIAVADKLINVIAVPNGNATEEAAGIVYVAAPSPRA